MGPESGGRWRCRQEEVGGRVRSQGRGGGPGGERFRGTDRGVATVWVAVTTVALCAVFALVLELGQAVTARHRAGGAADLAALAAADRALEGPEAACEAARRVALAQKAVLVRCSVQGEIADVVARSSLGRYAPAVRARAAPPAGPRAVAGRSSFASATSHRTVSAGPDVRVGRREHDFQVPRAPPGTSPHAAGGWRLKRAKMPFTNALSTGASSPGTAGSHSDRVHSEVCVIGAMRAESSPRISSGALGE
ncbi:Rv3654c family TadE-like protein [Streptomyces cyaneofuscatus]|uniref:Rv3654c family TadE-like protein n=1 Tax=Streptomyces cyaneofuscatus TaxID=66883 RepID=UPI0033B11DB2